MTERRKTHGNRQNLAWFVDLNRRDLLDLDPSYQRRSVWNQRYREDFIETVLLGYPAPSVFLFAEIADDGTTRYSVVDGKQRLTTVISFANDEFPTRDDTDSSLSDNQRGLYFKDLASDDKQAFWSYEFTVEYVPSTDEALLNEIFDRINRNVAKLTRQELRHARYEGKFATAIEEIADGMRDLFDASFPRIVESSRRQMKDVEVAALLALLVENGPTSTSQDDLDGFYATRDEDWEDAEKVDAWLTEDLDYIRRLLESTPDLASTRLRNQGDFYALVGAVDELRRQDSLPEDVAPGAERLRLFAEEVGDAEEREGPDSTARRYYEAARSAANDISQRQIRIGILKDTLAEPE